MCNQVLEYLNKPREALNELRSLLNLGSVGFISVPNFDDDIMQQNVSLLKKRLPAGKDADPLAYLNYFTSQNLKKIIFEAGFEEIKIGPAHKSILNIHFPIYSNLFRKHKIRQSTNNYVKAV